MLEANHSGGEKGHQDYGRGGPRGSYYPRLQQKKLPILLESEASHSPLGAWLFTPTVQSTGQGLVQGELQEQFLVNGLTMTPTHPSKPNPQALFEKLFLIAFCCCPQLQNKGFFLLGNQPRGLD